MKFIRLTIHNIASIEDAVIDFENGPLAADSLFLITGVTGSGKSTILDAICLALYCTTPRLSSGRRESYVDDREEFNHTGEEVNSTDVRMLVRRGSREAFVELVFTDKDDVELTSRWSCSQTVRAPYHLKDYVIELTNSRGELITNRKREFAEEILRRLGMTFEQFCRTTMLAQGEFTRFLKSSADEKSDILEKITGTGIYTLIGRRIGEIYAEKNKTVADLELQVQAFRLLTEEEIARIRAHIAQLQQQKAALTEQETQLSRHRDTLAAKAKADEKLSATRSELSALESEARTESFVRNLSLLHDWEHCDVRESWRRRGELRRHCETLMEEELRLKTVYTELLKGVNAARESLRILELEQTECDSFLAGEAPHAEMYRQTETILLLLEQNRKMREQLETLEQRAGEAERNLTRRQAESAHLEKELHRSQQEDDERQSALKKAQERLDGYDLEQLNGEQTRIRQHIEALNAFAVQYAQYTDAERRHRKCVEESVAARESLAVLEKELAALDAECRRADAEYRESEELFDKQKHSCDDLIRTLRHRLSAGDRCPLCGQTVSVLEKDEAFAAVLAPIAQQRDDKKRRRDEVFRHYSEKEAACNMERIHIGKCSREEESAREAYEAAKSSCTRNTLYALYAGCDEVEHSVRTALGEERRRAELLDQQIKAVAAVQKEVAQCMELQRLSASRVEQIRLSVGNVAEQITALQQEAAVCRSGRENCESVIRQNGQRLDALVSQPDWRDDLVRDPRRFSRMLRERTAAYHAGETRREELKKLHSREEQTLRSVLRLEENILGQQPQWRGIEVEAMVGCPDMENSWQRLSNAVTDNVSHLAARRKDLTVEEGRIAAYLQRGDAVSEERIAELSRIDPRQVDELKSRMAEYDHRVIAIKAQIAATQDDLTRLKEEMTQYTDGCSTSEELDGRLSLLGEELSQVLQQIGSENQIMVSDARNAARSTEVQAALTRAREVRAKWGSLNRIFGSANGKYFRNIAQSYILWELIRRANRYLRRLTPRYELTCQPGSLIILLRDHEAGGVVRPATTISGGESFLVSLALALGLSSLNGSRLSMDTIFIDEGFGTLDNTFLSTVMDTLERLHNMGGKKVGIISHVESLRERLTTQIRLVKESTTKSRVEVVGTI